MKNYKDYQKEFIGTSDIASLTIRTPLEAKTLNFGEDGNYNAYIVDEETIIPEHYKLVIKAKNWIKIYDDFKMTIKIEAKEIKIFQAGNRGIIIQKINNN